jgi:hypothetical protein
MKVRFDLFCRVATLLLAAAVAVAAMTSAQACMINEAYEPDKPFYDNYFYGAEVIFRGRPLSYRFPEPRSMTIIGDRAEITFDVLETYQGETRERWTAFWITVAFPKPIDLLAFKHEIGDDLVVVLDAPGAYSTEFTQFPFVAHQPCGQPAMRSYEVMEPVLREKGLIE